LQFTKAGTDLGISMGSILAIRTTTRKYKIFGPSPAQLINNVQRGIS